MKHSIQGIEPILNKSSVGTVIVAGAHKAGTTTLHSLLSRHPQIAMSVVKETNRYCPDLWPILSHIQPLCDAEIKTLHKTGKTRHLGLIKNEETYNLCFSLNEKTRYRGEASPFYLRSTEAAQEIAHHHPEARIIVVVRDPIQRLLSHYAMEIRDARIPEPIALAIREEQDALHNGQKSEHGLLDSGRYGEGLSRFFHHFSSQQILVMDLSELRDTGHLTQRIASFLGIDPSSFDLQTSKQNASVSARNPHLNRLLAQSGFKDMIRNYLPQFMIDALKPLYYHPTRQEPQLDKDLHTELVQFFQPDVRRLVSLLGDKSWGWLDRYL